MRHRPSIVSRLAALCVLFAACARPPHPPPQGIPRNDFTHLGERLAFEIQRRVDDGLTSLAVAVVDDKRVLWEGAAGYADVDLARRATVHTPYRAGSVSKLFTAVAVAQLVARGRIGLDDPLVSILPEFGLGPPPPFLPGAEDWRIEDVTLRRLLTHRAGIPSDLYKGMFSSEPRRYDEYAALLRSENAQAPAELAFAYSNLGYALLGHAVERVSGLPYPEYMARNLLAPAGMTNSSLDPEAYSAARVATAYAGGEAIDGKMLWNSPAGGLITSAHELAGFAQSLLAEGRGSQGSILSARDLEAMWVRQHPDLALDFDEASGLGFHHMTLGLDGAGPVVGHDGATIAHRALLVLLPERNLAFVALSNAAEAGAANAELARIALALALETRWGIRQPETAAPVPDAQYDPEPDLPRLDALAGLYSSAFGAFPLERRGERLRTPALLPGIRPELWPLRDGDFSIGLRALGLFHVQPFGMDQLRARFATADGFETVSAVLGRTGSR